jgi:AcrR family transcriptional regulator
MRKPGSNGAQTLRNLRIAAIQLLSEHGYQAMNLRMLAGKVGVQAGSLYNYIESKQQLLFWLLEETTQKLLVEFDLTLNGVDDPAERLRKFVGFHLAYHVANRKQSAVLQNEMRSLTTKNYHAIAKLQRLYTDKVLAIIEEGARLGRFRVDDAEIATFAILQMLTAIIRWYRPQGRLTLKQVIEIYNDLTFGMLRADDGAGTRRVALSEAPPRQRLRAITPATRRPPQDADSDANLIAES